MAGRRKPAEEKVSSRLPVGLTVGERADVEDLVASGQFESASEAVRSIFKRGLALTQPLLTPSRVPVYTMAGSTAAGPWLEVSDVEAYKVSDHDLLDYKDGDYLLVVDGDHGDCLTGDGIWPNDIVHLRPGLKPEIGEIVHVSATDSYSRSSTTLKHFHPIGRREIELRPNNDKYQPIRVKSSDITVHGVLVGFTHRGRVRRK